MSRIPKAVREHQQRQRAELALRQAARQYHRAVDVAEAALASVGDTIDDSEARGMVASLEVASKQLERVAYRFGELVPATRRRKVRR